jgi:hypothetical protein
MRMVAMAPLEHAYVGTVGAAMAVVEEDGSCTVGAVLRRFASRRVIAGGRGRGGDGRADHQGQGHR